MGEAERLAVRGAVGVLRALDADAEGRDARTVVRAAARIDHARDALGIAAPFDGGVRESVKVGGRGRGASHGGEEGGDEEADDGLDRGGGGNKEHDEDTDDKYQKETWSAPGSGAGGTKTA